MKGTDQVILAYIRIMVRAGSEELPGSDGLKVAVADGVGWLRLLATEEMVAEDAAEFEMRTACGWLEDAEDCRWLRMLKTPEQIGR
ncbi:hypothetical protein LXL04_022012 [Taraxacum kok-saghyz]